MATIDIHRRRYPNNEAHFTTKPHLVSEYLPAIKMESPILYVNGCSMAYGQELIFPRNDPAMFLDEAAMIPENNAWRLEKGWPTILGKILGMDTVVNRAEPGSSNARILRTTLADIHHMRTHGGIHKDSMFVIQWSHPERYEEWDNELGRFYQYIPSFDRHLDEKHKAYQQAKLLVSHNEEVARYMTFQHMLMLQYVLKAHKIKYLYALGLPLWAPTGRTSALLNKVGSALGLTNKQASSPFGFELDTSAFIGGSLKLNFLEWATSNGFPLAYYGHPLEAAHDAWARLIYDDTYTENTAEGEDDA